MAALFGHKVETERGEEDYVLPENSQSAGKTRMVELESIIYSQLIVTTHNDPILRDIDDIFGKDSVWFTEKVS